MGEDAHMATIALFYFLVEVSGDSNPGQRRRKMQMGMNKTLMALLATDGRGLTRDQLSGLTRDLRLRDLRRRSIYFGFCYS